MSSLTDNRFVRSCLEFALCWGSDADGELNDSGYHFLWSHDLGAHSAGESSHSVVGATTIDGKSSQANGVVVRFDLDHVNTADGALFVGVYDGHSGEFISGALFPRFYAKGINQPRRHVSPPAGPGAGRWAEWPGSGQRWPGSGQRPPPAGAVQEGNDLPPADGGDGGGGEGGGVGGGGGGGGGGRKWNVYHCSLCGQDCKHLYKLQGHRKIEHPTSTYCPLCDATFTVGYFRSHPCDATKEKLSGFLFRHFGIIL